MSNAVLPAIRKIASRLAFLPPWGTRLAALVASATYLGWDLSSREVTLLESQDLGIAHTLFKSFGLSPDHSPLHFVFLRLWESLDASSVAFLRAPSVAFTAIAVLVVGRIAKELGGRFAGALAAVFFATNPEVVDAARSMRMYALGILLATLCFWTAMAFVRTKQRRVFVAFTTVAVLAVYNHLFAWLLVGPLALWIGVVLRHERRRDDRADHLTSHRRSRTECAPGCPRGCRSRANCVGHTHAD